MVEHSFVTLVDATKKEPRPLTDIERDVILATSALDSIRRDIAGLEEAEKAATEVLRAFRDEFYNTVSDIFPGLGHRMSR